MGGFDPWIDAVTQRVMVATAQDQNAVAFPGGPPPPKGPVRHSDGARNGDVTAGSERAWQSPSTSSMGRREIRVTPLQRRTQPER
jgi:hypothetical protein